MTTDQKYTSVSVTAPQNQSITLENRNHLSVSGVNGVSRCDENEIIMSTVKGTLIVRGRNMFMSKLTAEAGSAVVDGEFDAVEFGDDGHRESLFARLFK